MPKTLLTGANGFVAAHVLDQLISAGHHVTGSVRSAAKGQQILDLHPEYAGHLNFVNISDYAADGVWDEVFKTHDFDYVIHTAAPVLDDPGNKDFDTDYLRPSVEGNIQLLQSAQAHGKNIKSIAVTGSINSMTTGADVRTRTFTSASWLPLTPADARRANNAYISYCVAKSEAERAIWAFVKTHRPRFSVAVLLPPLIFGPPLQPVASLRRINFSSDVFYALFRGGALDVVPPTSFGAYVDVRDLAAAHLVALTAPSVANQRFVVGGRPYSSALAMGVLRSMPELKDRKLPRDPDPAEDVPTVNLADVDEWNAKLGLKPRTAEETFGDAARRILELEKKLGRD